MLDRIGVGVVMAFGGLLSAPVWAAGGEFAPHVGVATVFKDGYVRAFMLDSRPGKVVLIDAGMDKKAKLILEELGRRGLDASAVEAIFLTHGHADHTSGCVAFPLARIYALAPEVDLIEGRAESKAPIAWTPLGWFMARSRPHVAVTDPMHDGQTVHWGRVHLTAYHVPGHTEGSAVFRVGSLLFLGDVASAKTPTMLQPSPWFFSQDVERDRQSVKTLVTRLRSAAPAIDWLLPSHSDALEGFGPLAAF